MLGPLLGAFALMGAVGITVWMLTGRSNQATVNLFAGLDMPVPIKVSPVMGAAQRLGQLLRKRLPTPVIDGLETKLVQAGHPYSLDLSRVLGIKAALAFVVLAVSLLTGNVLYGLAATPLVFFAPDVWLGRVRDRRRGEMQRAAADMIDQLTICVEAGLGFDAALARVARTNVGPLADELRHTISDMQAGVPRAQALRVLDERTDTPEIKRVVSALIQAQKHGIPLADTLRIQAAEMRLKRRQRTEEKAAKMPVKMVFPTLLCIMPCLFIVILGPAVIDMVHTLGSP
jgi:tight adherence protein C